MPYGVIHSDLADALATAVGRVREELGLEAEEMAYLLDTPVEVLRAAEAGHLEGPAARMLLLVAFEAALVGVVPAPKCARWVPRDPAGD